MRSFRTDCKADGRMSDATGAADRATRLLVPVTKEQFEESGLRLSYPHVVALAKDVDIIRKALRQFRSRDRIGLQYGCVRFTPTVKQTVA